MKIGNLGRLDPTLKVKNISGLSNGSKMDVVVWNEFSGDWEQLNKEFEESFPNTNQMMRIVILK